MKKPSMHPGRVILALVFAPLLGVAAGLFSLPYFGGEIISPPDIKSFIEALLVLWFMTLPVAIIFGALTHWALLRLKLWPVTAYTITGMLLGPFAIAVWNVMMSRSLHFDWPPAELAWLSVIVGGATALAFRLMVHQPSAPASSP